MTLDSTVRRKRKGDKKGRQAGRKKGNLTIDPVPASDPINPADDDTAAAAAGSRATTSSVCCVIWIT